MAIYFLLFTFYFLARLARLHKENLMPSLSNRVALITGGGRGIGKAIAEAFAGEGAKVVVTARTASELEPLVEGIKSRGGQALAITADLSDLAMPARVVEQTRQQFGPIEILVNNAGLGSSSNPKPVVEFDDAFWEMSLRVNLTAPYLLCKLVLPEMLTRKWGRIINVASINGKVPSLHGAAYTASKHGLLGLTKTLALEVAREGITVNAICPGPVRTVMNDKRIAYDANRRGISFEEQEKGMTPMGKRLEPEDIAPLAVYLASDGAKMVTGQGINIDGGIVMA
jgi:NAD(P)-dependent dehydrogenase (short-subunit alcohol dehydrogenase family)